MTLEDLINKKRIKSLPISTESGEYQTATKADLSPFPDVFFAKEAVIYRESSEYPWLSVNNNLEYIDHPLKETLNQNAPFFASDFVSLEIANEQPFAVAVCKIPLAHLRRGIAMVQWNKSPAVMPVQMKLAKDEEVEHKSLTLSPSGKWAYFATSEHRHFIMFVDPELPGGCLPPFSLNIEAPPIGSKVTWITNPEGLIIWNQQKFLYWDLSKVDIKSLMK